MNDILNSKCKEKSQILEDYSFFKIPGKGKDFEIVLYKKSYFKSEFYASNKISKEKALELSKDKNCTSTPTMKEKIAEIAK